MKKYRVEIDHSNAQDGSCFEEMFSVLASDEEDAAEKFADQYDSRGDYLIVNEGSALLRITPEDGGAPVRIVVSGRMTRLYVARRV